MLDHDYAYSIRYTPTRALCVCIQSEMAVENPLTTIVTLNGTEMWFDLLYLPSVYFHSILQTVGLEERPRQYPNPNIILWRCVVGDCDYFTYCSTYRSSFKQQSKKSAKRIVSRHKHEWKRQANDEL